MTYRKFSVSDTTGGWIIFIGALGMMAGLTSNDIINLHSWWDFWTPTFIGKMLLHFSSVATAFIGGRIIPTLKHKK